MSGYTARDLLVKTFHTEEIPIDKTEAKKNILEKFGGFVCYS